MRLAGLFVAAGVDKIRLTGTAAPRLSCRSRSTKAAHHARRTAAARVCEIGHAAPPPSVKPLSRLLSQHAAADALAHAPGRVPFAAPGGEPTVRRDLEEIAAGLRALPGLRHLGLTSNGIVLAKRLPALQAAGVDRCAPRVLRYATHLPPRNPQLAAPHPVPL